MAMRRSCLPPLMMSPSWMKSSVSAERFSTSRVLTVPVSCTTAQPAASALAAAQDADALMILTPWAEYREIPPGAIAAAMAGRTVLDPYRVLDPIAARNAGLRYHTLGMPVLEKEC